MIELNYFKSKLIGYLKEYAPDRIHEADWIELLSDTAYDEMNRLIKCNTERHIAQNSALSQMLSKVPDSLYLRLDALYEANYNPHSNTEGLPLFNRQERRETILSLIPIWPKTESKLTDAHCIQTIKSLIKEDNHGL